MAQIEEQKDVISESSAARLAYYFAFVPLAGFLFYMALAFLGLIQIGKGRTGFYRLRNGLIAVFFFSILPIAGLVWWAELPQSYYLVLKNFTRHGRIDTTNNRGETTEKNYFRFGKSFRLVKYTYYEKGARKSEEVFVGDKLHGKSSRWYENDKLMAETTYEDGKPKGESTYWYENGQPRLKENYVNGKRHGLTTWFGKDGKPERTMEYVNGISQEQIDAAKKAGVEPVIEVDLGGGVKMRMIFIPPGEFNMGSTPEEIAKVMKEVGLDWFMDEAPQHKVTIKQGFYLCETEITQAQWQAIAGTNPSYFKGNSNPVENVSWDDSKEFLQKLNGKGKGTFRLPSEAEWEYFARSRTTTIFGFGDEYADLGDYAWYVGNSGNLTHPVSEKKANNFGLYDIHGNVEEWCEDDWHGTYEKAPADGKAWIDLPRGTNRVLRGGSCLNIPCICRSAIRGWINPDTRSVNFGFRLVRTISK